jgi:hypothetical protein
MARRLRHQTHHRTVDPPGRRLRRPQPGTTPLRQRQTHRHPSLDLHPLEHHRPPPDRPHRQRRQLRRIRQRLHQQHPPLPHRPTPRRRRSHRRHPQRRPTQLNNATNSPRPVPAAPPGRADPWPRQRTRRPPSSANSRRRREVRGAAAHLSSHDKRTASKSPPVTQSQKARPLPTAGLEPSLHHSRKHHCGPFCGSRVRTKQTARRAQTVPMRSPRAPLTNPGPTQRATKSSSLPRSPRSDG